MLMMDQVRGEHSTGIAVVNRGDTAPRIAKAVGGATELFGLKAYDKALAGVNRVMIGHNRYATVGAITAANAHPFTRGAVTGVHNGSLQGYSNLEGYGEFAVDSEILYNHISEYGLADALENTYGAMALYWWNAQTRTVNIYRNEERPLYWATTVDQKVCMVASEPWMIQASAARQRTPIKLNDVEMVPVHMHISVEIPDNHYQELPTPQLTKLESRKQVYLGNGYGGNWNGRQYSSNSSTTTTVTPPPTNVSVGKPAEQGEKKDGVESNVKPFPKPVDDFKIPKGVLCTYYSIEEFHGYKWSVFYEVVGNREFVMPIDAVEKMGLAVGDTISGDCHGIIYSPYNDKNERTGYFKLHEPTVKTEEKAFQGALLAEDEDKTGEEVADIDGIPFLDGKGQLLDKTSWYKQYGTCSNCDGDVEHTGLFRFNKAGGIYCEECNTNPAVADALPA